MKDKYYYFNLGANSMKTEIAAKFMIANKVEEAIKVISMPLPNFSEPEVIEVDKD
jgi:hypothetical protein